VNLSANEFKERVLVKESKSTLILKRRRCSPVQSILARHTWLYIAFLATVQDDVFTGCET
jgi:hypothetical protein